jgi:methionine sulfoxide reductase heme-binding subunit
MMMRRPWGKAILWAVLAVPAVMTAAGFAIQPGMLLEDLLHPTGEWSARLMILALMFTPLSLLFPSNRAIGWLVRHRRAFGFGAFCYALFHLVIYIIDMGTLQLILAEIGALGIWTGWVAFLLMLPLALTSNNRAVKALGLGWKRLQRLAYPAALFTLIHWMFIHNGFASGLINFAPLILLQLARLALLLRRGSSRQPLKERYQ